MAERERAHAASQEDRVELQLTPMIDCVFLLLIFFLVTMKFRLEEGHLKSWLPRDRGLNTTQVVISLEQVRVNLDYDDGTSPPTCQALLDFRHPVAPVYDEEFKANCPNWGEIESYIRGAKERYRGLSDRGLPVTIDFTARTPVKFVVRVLDICTGIGIEDLSFAAPEIPIE